MGRTPTVVARTALSGITLGGTGVSSPQLRIVDLTPAVRETLTLYLADSDWQAPGDLVFPTSAGHQDNRNNVRRRCIVKAVERANKRLAKLGIAPIGTLSPQESAWSINASVPWDLAWKPADVRVIAFLQERQGRHIVGAGSTSLDPRAGKQIAAVSVSTNDPIDEKDRL